jgi:hypothetical protein
MRVTRGSATLTAGVCAAFVVTGASLSACAAPSPPVTPAPAADTVLVIEDVNVVTMTDDGVLEGRTVVIEDGRIRSVTEAGDAGIPEGAVRIDGSGRWLIPGLAEMHAHVPPGDPPEQLVEDILFLYLANGVTTIRGMLGAPYQLELRGRIESGDVLGPRFLVGAPSINGNSAPNPEAGARLVREYAEAGYDFLKLHPGLSRATYDAVVETAREVGITTGGHISVPVGLERTLEARQGTIDHMDGFLESTLPPALLERVRSPTDTVTPAEVWNAARASQLAPLARATREAGVWVVPTALLWENLYGPLDVEVAAAWPEMRYAPATMVEGWKRQKRGIAGQIAASGATEADIERYLAFRRAVLRTLAEEDVGILLGTDSPQLFSVPGFSLHREIEFMRSHGFTPEDILEAGTVNVAEYTSGVLGLDGDFGTVEAGQRADLVLLEGNPLGDLRHLRDPAGVIVGGRWLSGEELRAGLQAIAERNPAR